MYASEFYRYILQKRVSRSYQTTYWKEHQTKYERDEASDNIMPCHQQLTRAWKHLFLKINMPIPCHMFYTAIWGNSFSVEKVLPTLIRKEPPFTDPTNPHYVNEQFYLKKIGLLPSNSSFYSSFFHKILSTNAILKKFSDINVVCISVLALLLLNVAVFNSSTFSSFNKLKNPKKLIVVNMKGAQVC